MTRSVYSYLISSVNCICHISFIIENLYLSSPSRNGILINIDCLKSRSKTYSYGDITTATSKPSMLGAYDL